MKYKGMANICTILVKISQRHKLRHKRILKRSIGKQLMDLGVGMNSS